MDVPLVIKQRLEELELEQRDLAIAAGVTDSYVSQLLSGKKLPPAPDRSDIYAKMERFLKLSAGKLSELAAHQRHEQLRRSFGQAPVPLLKGVRDLILRKCAPEKEKGVRALFEGQPFGELERLVTKALGRCQEDRQRGITKRQLAASGGAHERPQLRGNESHHSRCPSINRSLTVRLSTNSMTM